jgi:Fumarase C C-terminus/D-isomer specific 2-hydroxyacid dehydrogenase, catalytic domain
MAKILCVLYPDPVDGYPPRYPRDDVPVLHGYPDGQTLPTPESIDFTPGELLGCVSGELGLRRFLEAAGHTLIVTSDKEGPDSIFEQELPDADVVISQPFWPAYLTAERIADAPNLKLAITAGIGSDHVDLNAAIADGITVAEVTFCNSISVAEHAVMQILALVRNFLGTELDRDKITDYVGRSLMLVTALSPHIGYDKASAIAHKADDEGTSLREAALALGVSAADFDRIVDPATMVGDPRRDLGLEPAPGREGS